MSLEEYTPDLESAEWSSESSNSSSEALSEKIREQIKKASAWTKRTKKDEKKAKKYDLLLASFLVKIIIDKNYDSILNVVFKTLDYWYGTNFIIWVLSLINNDISKEIKKVSGRDFLEFDFEKKYFIEFDDNNIPKDIKNKINSWIEDIIDSLTIENSSIITKKNIELLEKDEENINKYIASIFIYFLNSIEVKIKNKAALSIADFIKSEVKRTIKKQVLEEI